VHLTQTHFQRQALLYLKIEKVRLVSSNLFIDRKKAGILSILSHSQLAQTRGLKNCHRTHILELVDLVRP
jgi:hypothetical protein